MIFLEPIELVKCEVYFLDKSKQYISRILMARVTSIFELIYMDTAHIISINIDNITGFSGLTNDYSRYRHINIYVQKKNTFQNLINFQIKIRILYDLKQSKNI